MPLDAEKYAQALRYKALLQKQVGWLDVRCDVDGAPVRLNGKLIFTGPGQWKGVVRAGLQTIVATKQGYFPFEKTVTLLGDDKQLIQVDMIEAVAATEWKRLWPVWIPWVVMTGGVVLAGSSLGLHMSSRNIFMDYDSDILECIDPMTGGCTPSSAVTQKRIQAQALQVVSYVGYALSGAALAVGSVLLYMNRLQPYQKTVDIETQPKVYLLPSVGPSGIGAALSVSF